MGKVCRGRPLSRQAVNFDLTDRKYDFEMEIILKKNTICMHKNSNSLK